MKKLKIKKVFESNEINGDLSKLCNVRNAIYFQNKERTNSLISVFSYEFDEITYNELFRNTDKIYVVQTASNKFIEVEQSDMKNFQ